LNCLNNGKCVDKTETKAAYCDCLGLGYNGSYCENDINECEINNGGCNEQATCKNIQGGFECACKDGYSGDGISCNLTPTSPSDKNESNQTTGIEIGVGVGVGVLALLLLVLLILFFLRRKVTFSCLVKLSFLSDMKKNNEKKKRKKQRVNGIRANIFEKLNLIDFQLLKV